FLLRRTRPADYADIFKLSENYLRDLRTLIKHSRLQVIVSFAGQINLRNLRDVSAGGGTLRHADLKRPEPGPSFVEIPALADIKFNSV
ncbi:MAG: hypothetical protein DI535_28000, partial [Citrobacter freundii]